MKKARKGFTLVELLIVIAVMGILSSMAMIAGQEATSAARATNIADGLEKAATAMMMYYAENADTIDVSGVTVADLVAGANAYLKSSAQVVDTAAAGKYSVSVSEASKPEAAWFVTYTLATADASNAVGSALKNKTTRLGLLKEAKADGGEYDGKTTVAMKVR